jgi:hypothetical protein
MDFWGGWDAFCPMSRPCYYLEVLYIMGKLRVSFQCHYCTLVAVKLFFGFAVILASPRGYAKVISHVGGVLGAGHFCMMSISHALVVFSLK